MTVSAQRDRDASKSVGVLMDAVSKRYVTSDGDLDAVQSISLDVQPGEFVSILGPSGCGKSTLLMMAAGITPISQGQIFVGDAEVTRPLTDVGIVFQEPLLLEWRSSVRNVMLQAEARRLDSATYEDRARSLLERVGLAGCEELYPRELSGGMKTRVSICRALLHDPPLLLMDEPFGPLDALTREQMMEDLHSIWYEHRKTIVFITHSISEAVFLSDRVIVMTPRPGSVAAALEIELASPRGLEVQGSPEFRGYVDRIMALFREMGVLRH